MLLRPNDPITQIIAQEIDNLSPKSIVWDLGTSKRFAKEMNLFRSKLEKHTYKAMGYGVEYTYGKDNCDLDGDIENLSLKTNSVDMIFCIEVIEHVARPYKALEEMHRVLKPGGVLILTTPFLTPFHGKGDNLDDFSHGGYPDFWRYTHHGLLQLSRQFSQSQVYPFIGILSFFRTTLLGGKLQFLDSYLDKITPPKLGGPTNRHLLVARK